MLFQLLFTSFSFIFLPYPKTRDVYFGDLDSGSSCATEKSWEPGIWRPEKVEEMGYYYPLLPLFTDLLCNIGQVISLCSWVLSCAKWGGWTRCSLRSFQYFPLLWLSLEPLWLLHLYFVWTYEWMGIYTHTLFLEFSHMINVKFYKLWKHRKKEKKFSRAQYLLIRFILW